MTQLALFEFEKRWANGREAWVKPPELFSPGGFAVDVLAERVARRFVEREHYAASFPAARLSVGLWGPGPSLVGVAVFSVPMSTNVLPRWTGMDHRRAVELGRFVCAPSVKYNGESWFLVRCFRHLAREKGSRAVLSFSDPLERRTAAGALMKRQHFGTIYQATGALFAGRARARWLYLAPDGSVVSDRMLSKIRQEERGLDYGVARLRSYGAPQRRRGESWTDWTARVLMLPIFRRVFHPGNYAYVFSLNTPTRKAVARLHEGGKPYPKPPPLSSLELPLAA